MQRSGYVVRPNEPCILTEVFLPKMAELQGVLYETLTAGFRLQHVKDHFLAADPAKRRRIRETLSKGWAVFHPDYSDDEVRDFPRLFFGYSLYEVDGVFLKRKKGRPPGADADEDYSIEEDRTQVVRVIFKYPCRDCPVKVIEFCKAALRDPLSEVGTFRENHPHLAPRLDPEVTAALADLDTWVRYAGLFLFGYLLFEICDRIVGLEALKYGQRDPAEIRQDEIWVSSLWNLNVNVVEWAGPPGAKAEVPRKRPRRGRS